jgi:hypothetical protein
MIFKVLNEKYNLVAKLSLKNEGMINNFTDKSK